MKQASILASSFILLSLLFSLGCISNIDDEDKLNSTIDFNVDEYINKIEGPLPGDTPCSCMVCTQEDISVAERALFKLNPFDSKLIENALVGSECTFLPCNKTVYEDTIKYFDEKKGVWGDCKIEGEDYSCAPRFFMIGQGTSSAEFSLAQRYSQGRLTMPVIWAYPKKEGEAPTFPKPKTLMCHLAKNQMPIVVWYSNGKKINHPSYSNMLSSFNKPNDDIDGPIMVTTEALIDPYNYDDKGNPTFNMQLMQKIESQINTIKTQCPKCLVVLAFKPTFNSSGLPDMCPIDYFLSYKTLIDPPPEDPFDCKPLYPSSSDYNSRPSASAFTSYGDKIDLIGIGFIANNNNEMKSCNPMTDITRHLAYSRQILKSYRTPSVWYAIGMSAGPTLTNGCSFTENDVSDANNYLMRHIDGFVASGVIGYAPYKFLDSFSSLPLPCTSQKTLFITSSSSLDIIKNDQTISSSNPPDISLHIKKLLYSSENQKYFETSNHTYLAYLDEGFVTINETGCQFGFRKADGQLKNSSTFYWFSNTQFYYTNRGPLFTASSDTPSLDSISERDIIDSRDDPDNIYINVSIIVDDDEEEKQFLSPNGPGYKRFCAIQDDDEVDIYDMPLIDDTQQPLIFSSNGRGITCPLFPAIKMRTRSSYSNSPTVAQYGLSPPKDEDVLEEIAKLQCGACMFDTPMPIEFCEATQASFDGDACYQYPQMDDAFLQEELDPIFMRSLAQSESTLGTPGDIEASGPDAPACKIAPLSPVGTCWDRGDKPNNVLTASPSSYCTFDDITEVLADRGIDGTSVFACGLGVMQCLDAPGHVSAFTRDCGGAAYNPFDPYHSACCGSHAFNSAYNSALPIIRNLRSSNSYISEQIQEDEIEWFAAWLALDRSYLGMKMPISEMESYDPQTDGDNFVIFVRNYYQEQHDNGKDGAFPSPNYGTHIITRYNDGIEECNTGCLY
ncbi:MAG: hypothetical protein ABIH83_03925, partial [Candidatus Micrarchaeota archaeon]